MTDLLRIPHTFHTVEEVLATAAKLAIAEQALETINRESDTSADGELMKWFDGLCEHIKRVDHSGPRDNFEHFMEQFHYISGKALVEINKP